MMAWIKGVFVCLQLLSNVFLFNFWENFVFEDCLNAWNSNKMSMFLADITALATVAIELYRAFWLGVESCSNWDLISRPTCYCAVALQTEVSCRR